MNSETSGSTNEARDSADHESLTRADEAEESGALIDMLQALRHAAVEYAGRHDGLRSAIPAGAQASATNLLHYLALRQRDLRPLQDRLSHLGLSSLGRLEAHVEATLRAVIKALHHLRGTEDQIVFKSPDLSFEEGSNRLQDQAAAILGPSNPDQPTRIMVTMPGTAGDDPHLIRNLLDAGMSIMRINCAHDSITEWSAMLRRLREAEASTGRHCRVAFDLAGPKLRTGPVTTGPAVLRVKPSRDTCGRVVEPARLVLRPAMPEDLPDPALGLPVGPDGFHLLQAGRTLHLADARDRHRTLAIRTIDQSGLVIAECERTCYFTPGLRIEVVDGGQSLGSVVVAGFRPQPGAVSLAEGDRLVVMRGDSPGASATERSPARISCDFEPMFEDCRPGESILFDDGLIAGVILEVHADRLEVGIERCAKQPARLQAEKGINLPDSSFGVAALTPKDLRDLEEIVPLADMISLSFVRGPGDVEDLIRELDRPDAGDTGIVLKIETRSAVENLPAILLAAMRHPPVAVMIARGDLGVELGFERMAEIQEEILWICEAAHVPVIWATQVLESLAKRGVATRAEVTDAAMSGRAECVMLNKGPYIVQAVRTLSDILARMEDHQSKKFSRMRPLRIAGVHG